MSEKPKIIINIEGGVIHSVDSSVPADILIFDDDTEGVDFKNLTKLYEDEPPVYARLYNINEKDTSRGITAVFPMLVRKIFDTIKQ